MQLRALCLVLCTAAACGSKSTPPAGPTGDEPKVAWADMDHEQQEEYMEQVVLPTMKEKFVAFDAKFAEMNCKTCHGAGADSHEFHMPNPDLPKLDFAKPESEYTEEQKKTGEFMASVVVPEMARLLGTTPFDPATQQGFGCLGCHTTVDVK